MFQNVLSSINGVVIFPLISFVAFFLFFGAVGIYAFMQDKQQIKELSELPFSDQVTGEHKNK
ncbi:MAG: CcoQ/FixQ family Cbb3-type cytochrome c oxidase assembly chaperone [Chitinophagales bacterium]|nr:CcoQ/FixQ family Cbb3-type cytochrome c oxidase assembly chaperone [Chitinophagales bacterium]